MDSSNVQEYSQAILRGIFQEINKLFKPNVVSLQIKYQKTFFPIFLCKKYGLVTSSKPPLYCTQTVCNYYSSCISLLQIRYAEKELSITLIRFTLETNSVNSDFSFLKKSKRA